MCKNEMQKDNETCKNEMQRVYKFIIHSFTCLSYLSQDLSIYKFIQISFWTCGFSDGRAAVKADLDRLP